MMNTPCSLCNHFRTEIALSIARREYDRLRWLEDEQYKHRQTCELNTDGWYLGLWQNARVGVDVSYSGDLPQGA